MRRIEIDACDDLTLIAESRGGDLEAFGELWRRHSAAVSRAARAFTSFDPDDVTAEAFARVLRHVRAGGGPEREPRAYLIRTARNVASEWAKRELPTAELGENAEHTEATPDHADRVAHLTVTRSAYERLPEKWRIALWYREVEDLPVGECARLLGTTPNTATVILKRAREAFAQEWIRENIAHTATDAECVWVLQKLPRFTRGKASVGDAQRVTRHLSGCRSCSVSTSEARHLDRRLVLVLLPALFLLPEGTRLVTNTTARRLGSATARGASAHSAAASRSGRALARVAAVAASVVALSVSFAGLPEEATSRPQEEVVSPLPQESAPPVDPPEEDPEQNVTEQRFTVTPTPPSPHATPVVSQPVPPPAPEATSSPSDSATPSPSPDDDNDDPATVTPQALSIDPLPTQAGVYPLVSGQATPGALVTAVFSTAADSITVDTVADETGAWSLTAHSLEGVITMSLTQSYLDATGQTVVVAGPAATEFTVEQLVSILVVDLGNGSSKITVSGPGDTEVALVHPTLDAVDQTVALDATGTGSIEVSVAKSDLMGIQFRLHAAGSTGPWGSWG